MEKRLKLCKMIHWMSVAVCLGSVIAPIIFWKYIPQQIPQHYGASGQVDIWTEKSFLILLFFFAVMMLGAMCIAEYYVKSSLLSANSSEAERGSCYYTYPMLVVMNFSLQLMIAYLIFCCATARNLGSLFLPVTLAIVFLPVLYFIWKAYKAGASSEGAREHYRQKEFGDAGVVYRSKIDWWLGIILAAAVFYPLYIFVDRLVRYGRINWSIFFTEVLMLLIFIPLFRTKYILYSDHMVVVCFGKERIPYRCITSMKETHNPLSSAALSLDRLQIDYTNDRGGHNMILISPKSKKEFMQKVQEKRELS